MNCPHCPNAGVYQHTDGVWYCQPHYLALQRPLTNHEVQSQTAEAWQTYEEKL